MSIRWTDGRHLRRFFSVLFARKMLRRKRSAVGSVKCVRVLFGSTRSRCWWLCIFPSLVFVKWSTDLLDCASLVDWGRCIPRAQEEFRRCCLVNWKRVLRKAQHTTKYSVLDDHLIVNVLSLRRVIDRSLHTVRSLELQGIRWKFHRTIDGLAELDMQMVHKYAGPKKKKHLQVTHGWSQARLAQAKHEYEVFKRLPPWLRLSLHERLRFGCYMSHVSLWQNMIRRETPYAIILEDDAIILPNFSIELTSRLMRLPADWDILFLNGCLQRFGPYYDVGLRLSRGGLCTFGYAISLKGAHALMRHAVLRNEKPIDHVIDKEILRCHLLAFHSVPPLVHVLSNKSSTLAY